MNDYLEKQFVWWYHHYKEVYRFEPDFSDLQIPFCSRPNFNRLIIVPRGFRAGLWAAEITRFWDLEIVGSLDNEAFRHDRWPAFSYAVWIRDRQEADDELRHLSVETLDQRGIRGVTLLERLVAGSAYFFQTGQHMDQACETLCSGSHRSDGKIPSVRWRPDFQVMYIGWCSSWSRGGHLCTREVVV